MKIDHAVFHAGKNTCKAGRACRAYQGIPDFWWRSWQGLPCQTAKLTPHLQAPEGELPVSAHARSPPSADLDSAGQSVPEQHAEPHKHRGLLSADLQADATARHSSSPDTVSPYAA